MISIKENPCKQLQIDLTKNKYSVNWWNFKNSEMAKYQLFEPILIVDLLDFKNGLEILLNRKINPQEYENSTLLQHEFLKQIKVK